MKNELISIYQKRRKRNRGKYEKSFSLFFVQNMTLQNANFCNDVFYVRFKIFSNNKQHSPIENVQGGYMCQTILCGKERSKLYFIYPEKILVSINSKRNCIQVALQ